MESTHEAPVLEAAASGRRPAGELIVQNGRLQGARRPLAGPLTLIGRAEGCDIRVNVEQVSAYHCALVFAAEGLLLRDLKSEQGTRVNGEPVTSCVLHHGDLIAVGPCRFRVRLTEARLEAPLPAGDTGRPEASPLSLEDLQREQEALNIQAAAVAAQQAALFVEESRLRERQAALEQQETQLAAHLDEKRRRLVELRDKVLKAHATLQAERAAHEQNLAQATRELERNRAEVADGRFQCQAQRQRLLDLQRRLKRRWHRHWALERTALDRREQELAEEARKLGGERLQLQRERETLDQWRRRCNGEAELDRRELQAGRELLAREKAEFRKQTAGLARREAAVAAAERRLADQQREAEATRRALEKEIQGLEARIANQRRKILEQEKEAGRLAPSLPAPVSLPPSAGDGPAAEAPLGERGAALAALAGELADQRLHLAEQCRRLVRAQAQWHAEQEAAARDMETLARRLQTREQAVHLAEAQGQQRHEELFHLRRYLESWQSQLTARAVAWEGDRERSLAALQSREAAADRRLEAVENLRRQWRQRYQQGLARLRQQFAAWRDHWQQRPAELNEKSLEAEAARLDQRFRQIQRWVDDTAGREEKLSDREAAWEQQRAQTEMEAARVRQEVHRLNVQQAVYERQVAELKEEVERLARLLLGEDDPSSFTVGQAA